LEPKNETTKKIDNQIGTPNPARSAGGDVVTSEKAKEPRKVPLDGDRPFAGKAAHVTRTTEEVGGKLKSDQSELTRGSSRAPEKTTTAFAKQTDREPSKTETRLLEPPAKSRHPSEVSKPKGDVKTTQPESQKRSEVTQGKEGAIVAATEVSRRESPKTVDKSRGRLTESKDVLFVGHEKKSGESNYLRISKEHLARFAKEDVLEARMARQSNPEKEFQIYTSPKYAEPHLNIARLNPAHRESFLVFSLEKYGMSDFAREFNWHRPKEFKNVTLSTSDGKVFLKTDNNVVEVKRPKLFADGVAAIFEGSLGEERNGRRIRIAKRFESFDLHFNDYPTNHPRILYIKGLGIRIEIGHRVSQFEPDHRTRWIPAQSLKQKSEQEVPRITDHKLLKIDGSPMSRKEIRAWIDTEGSLDSPEFGGLRRGTMLQVTQKNREPLDAYVKGLAALGVRCKVDKDAGGCYVARTTDVEGIAKIIREVGPFRTPQKIEQTQRFLERLEAERNERRRVIERARKLLDL